MPILINRKDVVNLLENFIAYLLRWVWFKSCDGCFVHSFAVESLKDSKQWSWVKNEVVVVVCGAMFGEEKVNNSVALLSRVLVAFSVGQISALVSAIV